MEDSERIVRRALLKPLVRNRQKVAKHKALLAALDCLDRRALSESAIPELRDAVLELRRHNPKISMDKESIATWTSLIRTIYLAGRMSTQEYVFYVSCHIESIHESRMFDNKYEEINLIFTALDRIRQEHGLRQDEDWLVGEGPDEYNKLNKDFDIAESERLIATFREFEFHDLADLLVKNPTEYNRLRERGRRSAHHGDEQVYALMDIVKRYEEEARKAAAEKAYFAAVTSLGAGVEGLLLH